MLFGALLLGVCVACCPLAEGIFTQRQQVNEFSTSECTNLVCEQAHEQAKGLSKLALLDEFVSQTVFLLNDLMKNIDGELGKSAHSLLRYIHPHCEPTRKILEEVIEKQRLKVSATPTDLGEGIQPVAETESTTNSSVVGQGYDDKWSIDEFDRNGVKGDSGSSVYQTSTNGHKNSRDFSTSRDPSQGRHLGKGWSKQDTTATNSWSGSNKKPYNSREDGKKPSGQWSPAYGTDEEERTKSSIAKTLTSKDKEKEPDSEVKGCRGVSKGSMFWTPGLDSWCKQNCSKGYCPKTHCVC